MNNIITENYTTNQLVEDVRYNRTKVEALYLEVIDFQDDTQYDSYGNEASDLYLVVKYTLGQTYWKITGYRESYDGETWDSEFKEVFPKEVTRTIYE